ncbi:Gfo/Idh/MocA family oxidoreductase [Methanosalsum natronophilum]|uniref:Gfo/Idh/MocA family oxidoreductase n=1 Tax=Methanosalsum natronophilum TaxID=768733 RepID=UPI002168F84B|nr:Gfo/Idh/MocA family oxidoreductase [Methanosalsum natronophilum]MCS3924896.1 choline-phosphate cytidylyltransferase [Methanosalsum natronophilum]
MKKQTLVITYGTFDLFHDGHYKLLKRARDLGDQLIVGVTSEIFDQNRGKLNVQDELMQRVNNVKKTGLADKIIIEEYEGQKINDIIKYNVDIFAIGSDWKGKFDYLKEHCEVIYLDRTKGISSTELRSKKSGIIKLGIIGYGRIAERFIAESKFVSGVNIEGVFGLNLSRVKLFAENHELSFHTTNFSTFLEKVDAVYIASPHLTHYEYTKKALAADKHVLCEKPLVLNVDNATELYSLALLKDRVLLEGIKTAYSPGFLRLIGLAKSGLIGTIKNVDATFTKLVNQNCRELNAKEAGGSITELASYPLLAAIKILGRDFENFYFYSYFDSEKKVDLFTKFNLTYSNSIFTGKVGLGVKSEGDLIISGTKGYIYVPSPWWKTEFFEARFENPEYNKKYFYKFEGDGLRYELAEFISLINDRKKTRANYKLKVDDTIQIIKIIQAFIDKENVKEI